MQEPVLPNTVPFCVSEVLEALYFNECLRGTRAKMGIAMKWKGRGGEGGGGGVADSLSYKRDFL